MIRNRDYKLDNVKALLITLVVIGHLADFYVYTSTNMKFIYFFIYIFHMPLFIFLSGYFIKTTINGGRFKVEKVISYFLLYLLFEVIMYALFKYIFSVEETRFNTFNEIDAPWYLLAMSIWIILTYVLKQIKPLFLVLLSVLSGILIGYDSFVGDYLVLSRVIVFFPFFLLGYYIDQNKFVTFLSSQKLRILSLMVLIISFLFVFFNIEYIYQFRGFLTGRNSYEVLKQPIYGGFYRMVFYLLAVILSTACLFIVSKSKTIFTIIGQRTLQIYILHMPFIYILHHFHFTEWLVSISQQHWLKLYILFSIPMVIFLSFKPLGWPFHFIMRLKFKSLLKADNKNPG
ncbi:acyltransferase family protein [Bacillus altitudinis]|uniref:acyltransferase family protein n=1 Tax=Bacillus altitudinis TaxID=293387 RepID=UPI003735620C